MAGVYRSSAKNSVLNTEDMCHGDSIHFEFSLDIGTVSDSIQDRIEETDIVANLFTTDSIERFTMMSNSPRLGRLLTVDRGTILASALHEEELPGIPTETAVWTDGIDRGFATFAERVLTHELKENTTTEADQ